MNCSTKNEDVFLATSIEIFFSIMYINYNVKVEFKSNFSCYMEMLNIIITFHFEQYKNKSSPLNIN